MLEATGTGMVESLMLDKSDGSHPSDGDTQPYKCNLSCPNDVVLLNIVPSIPVMVVYLLVIVNQEKSPDLYLAIDDSGSTGI